MKHINLLTLAALLLGTLWLADAPAAQAQSATVPWANAYTALGRFGSNQNYLVSMDINTGACTRVAYGPSTGLPANSAVFPSQIWGTASSDWIQIIDTNNSTWCGTWGNMNPPARSVNNYIRINAGNSNDVVVGGNLPRLALGGDANDDALMVTGSSTTVSLWGLDGNDDFYAGTGATVNGENGDDWLCVTSGQTVAAFNGGFGTDWHCGSVTSVTGSSPKCPCFAP